MVFKIYGPPADLLAVFLPMPVTIRDLAFASFFGVWLTFYSLLECYIDHDPHDILRLEELLSPLLRLVHLPFTHRHPRGRVMRLMLQMYLLFRCASRH